MCDSLVAFFYSKRNDNMVPHYIPLLLLLLTPFCYCTYTTLDLLPIQWTSSSSSNQSNSLYMISLYQQEHLYLILQDSLTYRNSGYVYRIDPSIPTAEYNIKIVQYSSNDFIQEEIIQGDYFNITQIPAIYTGKVQYPFWIWILMSCIIVLCCCNYLCQCCSCLCRITIEVIANRE